MNYSMNYHIKTLSLVGLFLVAACSTGAQSLASQQDPGHKENGKVAGVEFSVPNGYTLEPTSDTNVVVMRHKKYGLAIFVAVPKTTIDDAYLTNLSNTLASQMAPKAKSFKWKLIPGDTDAKVSKFQSGGGNTKGYNGTKLFVTDYISLRVKDREALVGYITEMGEFNNSQKFLFELKGPGGMSMPGWYAQAHVIASVTGEKYEEINKGTFITGTPVKKN